MQPPAIGYASGKVILLGEHSVVYGGTAIAASIERGVSAQASFSRTTRLWLMGRWIAPGEAGLGVAFKELLEKMEVYDLEVRLDPDIPVGCGLGASAAMGVATARAIERLVQSRDASYAPGDSLLFEAVERWERVLHGNPSGIDLVAASGLGLLSFRRAEGPRRLKVARPLRVAIAIAGAPAETRSMVQAVAAFRQRDRALVDRIFSTIEHLVETAELRLASGDLVGLGQLLDANQAELERLNISNREIEAACQMARDAGALGAKLTGAGGGGCVIALTNGDPAPVLDAWRRAGLDAFCTAIGEGALRDPDLEPDPKEIVP